MIFFFLILRLTGDILFFISSNLDSQNIYIWKIISTLPLIVGIIFYLIKLSVKFDEIDFLLFFKIISRWLIVTLALMLLIEQIRPSVISAYLLEKDLLQLILNNVIAFLLIAFGFSLLFVSYRYLIFNINKYTRIFIVLILVFYIILYFIEILSNIYYNLSIENYNIFYLIIGLLIFISFSIKPTIALLNRRDVFKLILYTIGVISFIVLNLENIVNYHGPFNSTLEYFLNTSSQLLAIPLLIVGTLYLKIFFVSLLTLPTSEIVEQKTNEFNSITFLNSKIANTIDLDALLKTINELAIKSTNAKYSWIELISEDKIDKIYTQNIDPKVINSFHEETEFNDYLFNLKEIDLIRTINSKNFANSKISHILPHFSYAKSMIFVPLYFKTQKIGNLALLSDKEYGFNSSSIKILNAFTDNISIAIENAKLVEASIEKEKYKQELLLAKEIQDKLLPESLPNLTNYSLAAYSESAEIVGGDYYDYFILKNGNYCLVIGDVSGKGISATFYMAQLKGVILSAAKESNSVSELLMKANNILYGTMDKRIYITMSAIEILDSNGKIGICRAGHMPVIIKNRNGISSLTPSGLAIGLISSSKFNEVLETIYYQFEETDTCVLFTDGANELRNNDEVEFGIENLKQCINNSVFNSSNELLDNIKNTLFEFSRDINQIDDITLLAIKYK